jgi:hypothetical protein
LDRAQDVLIRVGLLTSGNVGAVPEPTLYTTAVNVEDDWVYPTSLPSVVVFLQAPVLATADRDASTTHVAPPSLERWVPKTTWEPNAAKGPLRSAVSEIGVLTIGTAAWASTGMNGTVISASTRLSASIGMPRLL